MKPFRQRVRELFAKAPPLITEASSLSEISIQIPNMIAFLEHQYGIQTSATDRQLSLEELVAKYGLPPAQIVFMEAQLKNQKDRIKEISAIEAQAILAGDPTATLLDVRESCEIKLANISGSHPLTPILLDEVLSIWNKNRVIILYCHFGVRSLDAAHFLANHGFTKIHSIHGGIDAWSVSVDPNVPRYQGNYC